MKFAISWYFNGLLYKESIERIESLFHVAPSVMLGTIPIEIVESKLTDIKNIPKDHDIGVIDLNKMKYYSTSQTFYVPINDYAK
jgi:hypothetical protein